MNAKQVALKLILDEIKIPSEIVTVADRKKVQKAIYLGQEAGVDLGFHFGWYKMGPYCPELTKEYYNLAEELAQSHHEYDENTLSPDVKAKLRVIASVIVTPPSIPLAQEDWMELLASVHYLMKFNSPERTKEILRIEKPNLVDFFDAAIDKLKGIDLLNT